jgi:hypothetical protein
MAAQRRAHEGRGFGALSRDDQDLVQRQVGGIIGKVSGKLMAESSRRANRISRI